jgi:NADH dehydrogenase
MPGTAVITGAFSNTGAAVAEELARRGWSLRTLTQRTPPPDTTIETFPLRFEPQPLERVLAGADVLIDTYWIRFPHGAVTFDTAIANSRRLFAAARVAGVRRIVHVSVSNASLASPLGYYRGKAVVDEAVRASGPGWAIVRPTLIVGPRDVLTNNIAWFLRRAPVFATPAGAGYRLQPILRSETARIVADAAESDDPVDVDAAGPEIVTFGEYVRRLAGALGLRRAIVEVPPGAVLAFLRLAGVLLRDTVLTREELAGLQDDRLVSSAAPLGRTSVFPWLEEHGASFGRTYANDTRTRFADSP